LTSKSIFLAIKPSINSIKPSIKFNWVHKHLILDFYSSKLNFLCQQGSHQSTKYCQISIFVFLNLLNQILAIFKALRHPLLTAIIFWIFFLFLVFFGREKVNLGNNPKMSYDNCPLFFNKLCKEEKGKDNRLTISRNDELF
jgi:hypothetical protein